jgi:D-alanyl-lipoteichoic acid acyltransferase DltB (MBOAT superfamily)
MLFNSYSFIFPYLPVVFIGTFWLGRHTHRLAALWLGMASLTFYAVWDARFIMLLLASIAFNYGAGYWIGIKRSGSARLSLSISRCWAISNTQIFSLPRSISFLADRF